MAGASAEGTAATAEAIVSAFCAAVSSFDAERIAPFLADDVVFMNVGLDITYGRAAVLERFAGYWAAFPEAFLFLIRNIGSSGDMVFTERVDVMGAEGRVAHLPCNGVFELRDGRIRHWRDYADMAMVRRLLAGEDVSAQEGMPPGTRDVR